VYAGVGWRTDQICGFSGWLGDGSNLWFLGFGGGWIKFVDAGVGWRINQTCGYSHWLVGWIKLQKFETGIEFNDSPVICNRTAISP